VCNKNNFFKNTDLFLAAVGIDSTPTSCWPIYRRSLYPLSREKKDEDIGKEVAIIDVSAGRDIATSSNDSKKL
jgi:hypothetical protein